MKLISIIMISMVVLMFGCAAQETTGDLPHEVPTEPETPVEPEPVPEPEPEPEPVELTCEEKAMKIIPKQWEMSLASNHDPDSGYWTVESPDKWTNDVDFDYKGDIRYQKGRHSGENTQLIYTRNIQNEKLFGEGGIKYSKKVTIRGIGGIQEFIIKPIFQPGRINAPKMQADRYTTTATITDYGFVMCEWLGD